MLQRAVAIVTLCGILAAGVVWLMELQSTIFGLYAALQDEVHERDLKFKDQLSDQAETLRRNCYAIQDLERRQIGAMHHRCPPVPMVNPDSQRNP